jgi:hypothetical protein
VIFVANGNLLQAEWWWKWGRPADIWVMQRDLVRQFVERHDLQAIPAEQLGMTRPMAARSGAPAGQETLAARALWPYPFPGGLRIPHLHLDAEIYPLNREQWHAFSRQVMDDFRERLADVGSVSFDQVLEVSNALSGVV